MPEVTFRTAEPGDAALLRRWDDEPDVVASDPHDDWNWDVELARRPLWREQWVAEVEGRAIGFVQIIDPALEESHYWGEDVAGDLRAIDLWIGEADFRGRGYGSQMMRLAIDRCFADQNVSAIIIDPLASNTRACRFYERLGFQFVERRWFGEDECHVYRLERIDWA